MEKEKLEDRVGEVIYGASTKAVRSWRWHLPWHPKLVLAVGRAGGACLASLILSRSNKRSRAGLGWSGKCAPLAGTFNSVLAFFQLCFSASWSWRCANTKFSRPTERGSGDDALSDGPPLPAIVELVDPAVQGRTCSRQNNSRHLLLTLLRVIIAALSYDSIPSIAIIPYGILSHGTRA